MTLRTIAQQLRSSDRRGAATVEAALALPILFLLVFGGWEFSRINVIRNTMSNACYEAAREATLPGATETKVKDAGQTVLNAVGISNSTIEMTPSILTPSTKSVTVDVNVPVQGNGFGLSKFFLDGDIKSSCTLSRELVPGTF